MENYKPGLQACFIATAVYGDVNVHQVEILRRFRDEVLSHNFLGQAFISLYYGGVGQGTARFIESYVPSAIPVIRKGLDTLVEKLEKRN